MSERSRRRAATRQAAKLAKKQPAPPAPIAQTRAAAATSFTEAFDDQPPGRLDPAPDRPVPSHLLDPVEESAVEIADFYERRRQRLGAEFAAQLAARDAANSRPSNSESPNSQSANSTISEAQLAANRANAQKSTGATTPEGKANSSRNNFRHGLTHTEGDLILLVDESKEDYSRRLAEFQKEWQPETATERDLVERLASRQWLRRRAMRIQTMYLADNGQILDYEQHALYRRYEATHERGFNKALADLIRLRSLRLRQQNGFESQRRKDKEHDIRIRMLQNREKLQELALKTSEAKLAKLQTRKNDPEASQNGSEPPLSEPPLR